MNGGANHWIYPGTFCSFTSWQECHATKVENTVAKMPRSSYANVGQIIIAVIKIKKKNKNISNTFYKYFWKSRP
jgi:hypothetical protein